MKIHDMTDVEIKSNIKEKLNECDNNLKKLRDIQNIDSSEILKKNEQLLNEVRLLMDEEDRRVMV